MTVDLWPEPLLSWRHSTVRFWAFWSLSHVRCFTSLSLAIGKRGVLKRLSLLAYTLLSNISKNQTDMWEFSSTISVRPLTQYFHSNYVILQHCLCTLPTSGYWVFSWKDVKIVKDCLLKRRQTVKIGSNRSSPLGLNTGSPQGCNSVPAFYYLNA